MANDILAEAMGDAKLLKETAIENAKNVLVEAISDNIKEFIDDQLGEGESELDVAGMYEMEEPEGEEEEMPTLEPEEETEDEAFMWEGEEEEKDEPKCDEGEEVVEITEDDLKSAFMEVVSGIKDELSEAQVTKSFGDVEDPTPKTAGGKGQTGIADEKGGEAHWKDETPPAKQDWTVKETYYRKVIKKLMGENAGLKKEYSELAQGFKLLKRNLQEVNLFNSKLMYTNKLIQNADLNNKQRVAVIEALDRAESLREVQLVYKSLSESLKIAGVLSEGRQVRRTRKGPKASRPVGRAVNNDLLNESLERESGNGWVGRQQVLAGLKDLVE